MQKPNWGSISKNYACAERKKKNCVLRAVCWKQKAPSISWQEEVGSQPTKICGHSSTAGITDVAHIVLGKKRDQNSPSDFPGKECN